ncbi:ubiquitin-associated protein 2-like isoform X2 [Ptychodera flava]|uniref:ubiquitin-associated protein 2-like isoform X2 n=1 Tax=Ptychodera flava TaxID=63121 RepID=UPI003969DE45
MMSTVGTTRANTRSSSAREKPASKSSTHNTNHTTVQPGKQNVQPTAEQLRMAQIISSDDPETLAKIQQVQDVTGKSQDEVMVALHDHDDDPEKAINFLLENGDADQGQWETTGRKKKGRNQPAIQRMEPSSTASKDKVREKDRDRDRGSREREHRDKDNRDGSASRGRGRGRDRDRDGPPPRMRGRGKENGSVSERNERNRQNGEFGGRGRGSRDRDDRWNRDDNRPGGRYGQMNGPSRRGRGPRMGTFNSSDYKGSREFVNSKLDEISVWSNPPESTIAPNTTTETGTWGDVVHKTEEWGAEGDWGGDLTESKVFTPSIAPPRSQAQKSPIPDQSATMSNSINIAALLQKSTEPTAPAGGDSVSSARPSSHVLGGDSVSSARQSSHVLSQFTDMKTQAVTEPPKPQVGLVSQSQTLGPQSLGPTTSVSIGPVSLGTIMAVGSSPVGSTAGMVGSTSHPQRPQQPKPQKKKMPPPSKIPASAVEMPMSSYSSSMGSLDVQFGALEFGSDVGDFSSTNDSVATCSAPSLMSSSSVSVSEVSSVSSHLSSFSSKPSDTYDGSMMSSSMMSSTSVTMTTTAPIVSSLEQSSMPAYSQSTSTSQSKPLQPDPLSLPSQSSSLMGSSQRISQQSALDAVRSVTSTSSPSSMTSSMSVPQTGPTSLSSTVPPPSSLSSLSSHSHSSNLPSTLPSAGSNLMSSSSLSSHHSGLSPSSHTGLGSSSHQPTYSSTTTLPSHSSSGLSGSDVTGSSHPSHSSVQSSPMSAGKLSGLSSVKDSSLDSHVHQSQSTLGSGSLGSVSSSHSVPSYSSPSTTSSSTMSANVSAALGFSTSTATTSSTTTKATTQSTSSSKSALNLPPGMPPLLNQLAAGHQYIMAPGLLPAYHQPMYNYEDLQLLQRMPMGYPYDMQQFQPNTTMTTDRSGASLGNVQYSVTEATKFSRTDASSPIVTSVASQQQQQQQQQPGQGSHHQQQQQQQQAFLNPTLPPGYSYGGLAYYPGTAGVVPGMQYGPAMFPTVGTVPPSTRSQGSTAPHSGFQQPGAYGQHGSHGGYGTGYDDLTQTADFSKPGYQTASQSQSKGTGASGKISGTSTSAASDMSGSVYGSKTHAQTYDKQGFHAGTPPPFNIPLASGSQGGTMNPATGYATSPAQYVPLMAHPHQHQHQHQHHSPMLPHQLHGDGPQAGSAQRSQAGSNQAKQGVNKQTYSYNWGT